MDNISKTKTLLEANDPIEKKLIKAIEKLLAPMFKKVDVKRFKGGQDLSFQGSYTFDIFRETDRRPYGKFGSISVEVDVLNKPNKVTSWMPHDGNTTYRDFSQKFEKLIGMKV